MTHFAGKRLTTYSDRREWDLSGFTLISLTFDYAATLLIDMPGSSLRITIETTCTLHIDSHSESMEPKESKSMAPLLPLLRHPLSSLIVFRNGLLILKFKNRTELHVAKDEQYESWNAVGNGDLADIALLCSPHPDSTWIQ
jgi:hypothetical protein